MIALYIASGVLAVAAVALLIATMQVVIRIFSIPGPGPGYRGE